MKMYKQFLILFFLFDLSFLFGDEINLKDDYSINNKSKIDDEPLISMTSNFVPKYFPNQQKAYHQQYDKTANHLSTKKLINKPKLGKQISLDHHSFNNVAESVLQSTNMLIGNTFQDELKNDFKNEFKNEFGKEYPYKPTFLRFETTDGRNDIKPSSRIDYNKNYHNDKNQNAFKSIYNSKSIDYQSPATNYEDYKDLSTVKEPQITYSANSKYLHPPALPMYNPNYASYRPPTYQLKPNYSSKEQIDSKYYSSNQPAYSSPAPSNHISHQSNQPLQPNYQPNYQSNYQSNYQPTKDEDKSLEETIAELPNILAKSGLISATNSAKPQKIDKQTLIKPVVVVELPHKHSNDKHYPPYHYVLNKDHHLKESEEAHKKYQYNSHSYNQNDLIGNNRNRKHKDEYYSSDNGYQTLNYIHKDVHEPYTTYSTANSSEIGDYESSSIYSEIRTKDESRKHNKTKNYYVIYKLDDRRFEDELNHHINHHLRNEEEKINSSGEQNDYHEVINLSPMIGDNGDSLDRLFTIDTINSYIKDENNNKKEYNSQEEYVDPNDELKNYSNDKDYKGKSKIYQSMRNRDQYKQYTSADGREIVHIKYGQQNPLNYLNNNNYEKEYKDRPKSIDNLELESIIHNEPDLKKISPIENYNTSSNLFDSYNYKKNLTNKSKIIKYEPERLSDRERIYLFANTEKKQKFDKENLKLSNYGIIDQTASTINENRNYNNKNKDNYYQSPTTSSKLLNSNYNHPNSKESLIEESYKSEYNDQSHSKETSVFKLKTYDDYLHENYGKGIIRPKY